MPFWRGFLNSGRGLLVKTAKLQTATGVVTTWNTQTRMLTLDWSGFLGYPCVQTIADWEQGLHVRHFVDGIEEPADLSSVGEVLFIGEFDELRHILESIPEAVMDGFYAVPTHRLPLLNLAARYSSIAELLGSNPLLLWATYTHCLRNKGSERDLLDLVSAKQKVLAQHVGIEGGNQSVKILKKFSRENIDASQASKLFELLASDGVRHYFSHRVAPCIGEVLVLRDFPWLVRGSSRALIPQLNTRARNQLLLDVVNMVDGIDEIQACDSLVTLGILHDRLVGELINRGAAKSFRRDEDGNILPLPLPPFADGSGIAALSTQQAIFEEGATMHHCVASYTSRVLDDKYYVYAMTEPERLTIGLKIATGGVWVVDQIKGRRNASPDNASVDLIERWLCQAQDVANLPERYR